MRDLQAEANAVAHMKAQKAGKALFAKMKGGRDRMLIDQGAAAERAKIAAWLRENYSGAYEYGSAYAEYIEAGEHLK